jgi:hypothetical protein
VRPVDAFALTHMEPDMPAMPLAPHLRTCLRLTGIPYGSVGDSHRVTRSWPLTTLRRLAYSSSRQIQPRSRAGNSPRTCSRPGCMEGEVHGIDRQAHWLPSVACGLWQRGMRGTASHPAASASPPEPSGLPWNGRGASVLVREGDDEGILSWRHGICTAVQLPHHVADTLQLSRPRHLGAELPGGHGRVPACRGDGFRLD